MGILRVLPLLPGIIFGSFVPWYCWEQPKRITGHYRAYASAFLEILSIPFLLKTLFSPWKSIIDEYPSNRMNFGEVAQVFTLNCTTRIIGFLFRSVALVLAVIAQIFFLVLFLCYLLLWISYPVLLVTALLHVTGIL